MGGEGLKNSVKTNVVELTAEEELDDDDLFNKINEENDSDEEESEAFAFTSKVVHDRLDLVRKWVKNFKKMMRMLNQLFDSSEILINA